MLTGRRVHAVVRLANRRRLLLATHDKRADRHECAQRELHAELYNFTNELS